MQTSTTAPPTNVFARFRSDLPFYSRVCLRIRTKSARVVPLELNQPQRLVHAKIAAQRATTGRVRVLILKARQMGISTYVAARIFRACSLWPWRRGVVIADEGGRGSELFGIYERFYDHLPVKVRPIKRFTAKGQHMKFNRIGGGGLDSEIGVETAGDTEAGRSITIHYLHGSEIAFWAHPEETVLSLMQAIPDDGSEVVWESTANGVGNYFHREWQDAENGENDYVTIFLPWFIMEEYTVASLTADERAEVLASLDAWERKAHLEGIPFEGRPWKLSLEQLVWRRRTIRNKCGGDLRKFRQEYPATAREAFLVSGNCFFDEDAVMRYEESARPPTFRGNLVSDGLAVRFAPAERGALRVWETPKAEVDCPDCHGTGASGPPPDARHPAPRCGRCRGKGRLKTRYVIGADTAEGRSVSVRATDFSDPEGERGGRDFNSADVFECETGQMVAQVHYRTAPEVFGTDLWRLGYWYASGGSRPALIGVERNHSSGQTTLRKLQDRKYPNLFVRVWINKRTNAQTNEIGWVTSGETRMPMLDELAAAIRDDAIGYPNASGLAEFLTFVRADDGRPEAQEGCHDDRVVSAAIALQMARYSPQAPISEPTEPEVSETPTGWS